MRRWLLLFLVLLLPLRGWVGEAMAGQMLQEHIAAAAHAAPAHGAAHAEAGHPHAGADHHGHAHGHAEAKPAGHPASSVGDCGTCAACQVCSSVALSPSPPVIAAGGFSQPRPESVQRRYTSAEPLLAFKPPRG